MKKTDVKIFEPKTEQLYAEYFWWIGAAVKGVGGW